MDLSINTFFLDVLGETKEKTIANDININNSYNEMRDLYASENRHFEEAEFEFSYDTASFLAYYSNVLSLAGLGRLTGVAQGQLSHYVTGKRKPSKRRTY